MKVKKVQKDKKTMLVKTVKKRIKQVKQEMKDRKIRKDKKDAQVKPIVDKADNSLVLHALGPKHVRIRVFFPRFLCIGGYRSGGHEGLLIPRDACALGGHKCVCHS